jgi:plasmid stability protein
MEAVMATMTIRNVPDDVKQTLRVMAAEDGRSLEDSLRQLMLEKARGAEGRTSRIDANEIMRRARELESDPPQDRRFEHYSNKELSDTLCGVYDDLI